MRQKRDINQTEMFCSSCRETKKAEEFCFKKREGRYRSDCRSCETDEVRQYRKTERGKRLQRLSHVKRVYGLSEQEYDDLLVDCGNCCSICAISFKEIVPRVDHDHVTGEIRGLLCDDCNVGLGRFKDDVENVRSALRYLETYKRCERSHRKD